MKEATIGNKVELTEAELEQINRFTRKKLGAEELYTFTVVLCDNEIDRDCEQFSVKTLEQLAQLFVGKTGIFDHSMKGADQKARIYAAKTEFVQGQANRIGEPYCRLSAKAYMLRTSENEALIGEIDAGIKKEVSVGVSIGQSVCSVCGQNVKDSPCSHQPGRNYSGKSCYRILEDAGDAYEWSFVAVPAQPKAGVIKAFSPGHRGGGSTIDGLRKAHGELNLSRAEKHALLDEITAIEEEAKLGRAYKKSLQSQVEALLPLAMPAMDPEVFSHVAQVMTVEELKSFRKAFEERKNTVIPPTAQLAPDSKPVKENFSQFKI